MKFFINLPKTLLLLSFAATGLTAADAAQAGPTPEKLAAIASTPTLHFLQTLQKTEYRFEATDAQGEKQLGYIKFTITLYPQLPRHHSRAYINFLFTEEKHRRRKIGSYLFSEAIRFIIAQSIETIEWEVADGKSSEHLKIFYSKLGGESCLEPLEHDCNFRFNPAKIGSLVPSAPEDCQVTQCLHKQEFEASIDQQLSSTNNRPVCTIAYKWERLARRFEVQAVRVENQFNRTLIEQLRQFIAVKLNVGVENVKQQIRFAPPDLDDEFA